MRVRRWLLAVPLAALAWPPLYNRAEPAIFGVPFFYAYQLFVVPLAVVCMLVADAAVNAASGRGSRGSRRPRSRPRRAAPQ